MLNKGDIVAVIGYDSIPKSFLGSYGRVTDVSEEKIFVEFKIQVNAYGSLTHSAYPKDLYVVGREMAIVD